MIQQYREEENMNDYVIFTDTGCDILPDILDEWNVKLIDLLFRDTATDQIYTQRDMPTEVFYQKMKEGASFRTSAANMEDFSNAFVPYLEKGTDILYVGFTSGQSGTVNTAAIVARELEEQYPERKVTVIDTLCSSAGLGLMVYFAKERRDAGDSMDEVEAYIRERIPYLCHWFTVDDLQYLARSGRCSKAAAFMGSVLNIKPILHVDEEGKIVPLYKVRKKKKSINTVAEGYVELAQDPKGTFFICNSDCREDAKMLDDLIFQKTGVHAKIITDIGPVIGSHCGPGTLAVFFVSKKR